MSGCGYCRLQQSFWAIDDTGRMGNFNAHIEVGTNVFSDTAGRRINFRYCPMCGNSLLSNPNDRSGLSGVFSGLFLPRAYKSLRRKEC